MAFNSTMRKDMFHTDANFQQGRCDEDRAMTCQRICLSTKKHNTLVKRYSL